MSNTKKQDAIWKTGRRSSVLFFSFRYSDPNVPNVQKITNKIIASSEKKRRGAGPINSNYRIG